MHRRAKLSLKLLVAPLVAAALSLLAFGAINGLIWHASHHRDAEDKIADIRIGIDALQGLAWKPLSPQGPSVAQISAQVRAGERSIDRDLAGLTHRYPIPALVGVRRTLRANYATLDEIFSALADHQMGRVGALSTAQYRTTDAVVRELARAREAYLSLAHAALLDASRGSGIAVLVLLTGFLFFYVRTVRSNASAEELSRALRDSEAHLARAQRLAQLGSWEWHMARGSLTFTWSEEQRRLHGWNRVGPPTTIDDVLPLLAAGDGTRVLEELTEAFTRDESLETDYELSDGSGRVIHLQGEIVHDERGRPVGMIGTCQDVTERLRRVEAERANQAKNEFISRMSHELRTPLNAILGFGQLLEMSHLDAADHESAEHIVKAGRHLLELINEILDISRIESGGLRLSLEPVPVAAVVGGATDLVLPLAATRGISVRATLEDPNVWVTGDLQRLNQVLLNLLSNAVKYNREGGNVEVRIAGALAGRVRIVVADDGPGIAPRLMDKLFQPFERLGAEQSAVEGTGLGLALSRGMIEAMGGTIGVVSSMGQGTEFTIELDAAEPVRPNATAPTSASTPAGMSGRYQVLCIEDNPSSLALIERIFRARPAIKVLQASSGLVGVSLARAQQPDLVLLDLNLPDLDGEEVLARLKAEPSTRDVPVVVVSAEAIGGHPERLVARGAHSYMTKPINVEELLRVADEAVLGRHVHTTA